MEPSFLKGFPEFADSHNSQQEEDIVLGEKRKYISPTSQNDPKLEALQTCLIEWINTTLKQEQIVVRSLEKDLYDGLVLHHLLEKLGSVTLEVEKIALTEKKQRLKLTVILDTVSQVLNLEENELKWSVDAIFKKDLLSTLHLLVAIAEHFRPNFAIPPDVKVDIINVEHTPNGLKAENAVELITKSRENEENSSKAEIFDELLKHAPEKLDAVKEVLVKFVNKHVAKLGLNVKDVNSQFADGVILLLLIGQLQGYFLNLGDFFLNPSSVSEMVRQDELQNKLTKRCIHFGSFTSGLDTEEDEDEDDDNNNNIVHNVNLALELLVDGGLVDTPINPEDVVNQDLNATLLILYSLFSRYKMKET